VLPADAESSLWRAVAAYRLLVLGYLAVIVLVRWHGYARPWAGWLVFAVIAAWTLACLRLFPPREPAWPLLLADLGVACAGIVLTIVVETDANIDAGAPTLPTFWASGCVLAWGVRYGSGGGAVSAAGIAIANQVVHPGFDGDTFGNIFLLFLAGIVVGYVSNLVRAAEAERIRAAALAAATGERERLARDIHDGVLQILALVRRRGLELGGEPAELGRLAGEQERILRLLVGGPSTVDRTGGDADLAGELRVAVARRPYASLVAPAEPVPIGPAVAREVTAAVVAALDNVERHAGPGARAWVLLEDEAGAVTVTVRDDGVGMPAGRLAAARTEGRLGVAQSIVGRLRALGGDAVVTSDADGTEVELRLPGGEA
jgi:signal transduction histidine kinase